MLDSHKTNRRMDFNYIAPEMIYTCPMIGEKFYSHKKYCLDNPPCLYFNSIKKDGYGDAIFFDVIICEFPQSFWGNSEMSVFVLVVPDPDEWVQIGRPPHIIIVPLGKEEEFAKNTLSMNGKEIRKWLDENGIENPYVVPLSTIDYVVCVW